MKRIKRSIASKFGYEVFHLLQSAYFYREEIPDSDDAYENLRTLTIRRVLYDDMVLRLYKLSENNRAGTQALRWLQTSGAPESDIESAHKSLLALQEYAASVRSYRHHRLAHLGDDPPDTQQHQNLMRGITAAVGLADALNGGRNTYFFIEVDLRAAVLREWDAQ